MLCAVELWRHYSFQLHQSPCSEPIFLDVITTHCELNSQVLIIVSSTTIIEIKVWAFIEFQWLVCDMQMVQRADGLIKINHWQVDNVVLGNVQCAPICIEMRRTKKKSSRPLRTCMSCLQVRIDKPKRNCIQKKWKCLFEFSIVCNYTWLFRQGGPWHETHNDFNSNESEFNLRNVDARIARIWTHQRSV